MTLVFTFISRECNVLLISKIYPIFKYLWRIIERHELKMLRFLYSNLAACKKPITYLNNCRWFHSFGRSRCGEERHRKLCIDTNMLCVCVVILMSLHLFAFILKTQVIKCSMFIHSYYIIIILFSYFIYMYINTYRWKWNKYSLVKISLENG